MSFSCRVPEKTPLSPVCKRGALTRGFTSSSALAVEKI